MWCQLSHESGTVPPMTTEQVVGQVIGEHLYRLRVAAGETQADAAKRIAECGLPWKRDQVIALETGNRKSVSVEELVILSWAYNIHISEWFTGSGEILLAPDTYISRVDLERELRGERVSRPRDIDFSEVVELEADERVAQRLGVDTSEVTRIARDLWGHTLTDERNRRLEDSGKSDPKELRTLRAGMTKRLMKEISLQLEENA